MHAAPMGTSAPGGLGGPPTVLLVLSPVHASPCDVLGLLPAVVAPLLEGWRATAPTHPHYPYPQSFHFAKTCPMGPNHHIGGPDTVLCPYQKWVVKDLTILVVV